jgi:hypothetical protein
MSVEDFLKNPKTVEIVLSSLGRKVTLPSEGFLAGGSVANMLLSLYHQGTPCKFKVNDVDIFNVVDPNTIDAKMLDGEGEELLRGDVHLGMQVGMDEGYGHVYIERDGTYYKVMSAERNGLINDIKCFVSHGESGGQTIRFTPPPPIENPDQHMMPVTMNTVAIPNIDPANDVILRGFDLNCCQAGIDLSNGVLHYTDSFVKFLKSKQVFIDIPYTPFHTAIRLVKKMEMYGDFCYCDVDYEMNYLYQATGSDEACMFFGKENYDKFITYHDWLVDYIEVKSVEIKNMPHEYRKKYFPNSFKVINKSINGNLTMTPVGHDNYVGVEMVDGRELWTYKFTKEFDDIPDGFEKMWELKKIWDFKYRYIKKSHKTKIDTIMSYGKQNLGKNKLTLKGLKPTMRQKELIYNLEQSDNQMSYPVQCLMANEYYYKCDFTKEHLDEIVGFVNEHKRLGGLLSRVDTVQEQYNHVKMIKSLAKQEGQWIIGTLETLGLQEMIKGTIISKEWVEGLIEKEKERMSTPLLEPINLDKFKYKDCVTELVKPLDLKMEGEKMGHCVGGYSYNLEQGESRIFHIEVDGISSTLEVGLVKWDNDFSFELDTQSNRDQHKPKKRKQFSLKQHQGRYPVKMGNQTPTNKCRGVAMKLVYYITKQELSDSEFKELFKLKEVKTYNHTSNYNGLHDTSCRNFEKNKKTVNEWPKLLNDRHRGKNSLNKKKKKKTGNIFDDMLAF